MRPPGPTRKRQRKDERKRMRKAPPDRCPTSGKLSFATRAKARKHLLHVLGETATSKRVYQCPHCDNWHLTSMARQPRRVPRPKGTG